MENEQYRMATIMHLLQLSDSALPVGAFSFSATLESAANVGVVKDEATLEQYTREVVRTVAFTDGVAALTAWQATTDSDYEAVIAADRALYCSKPNDEARIMSQRMGRKLAELMAPLFKHEFLTRWHEDIKQQRISGNYAITQAIVAQICCVEKSELFCSICYGAASIILGAALRATRTTHFATQGILFRLADFIGEMYGQAKDMRLDEMHSFSPQCDIMASLHEKGSKRLFMN